MHSSGVYLFFGPPNAGKGTLCQLICSTLNVIPLGVGDICREEKKNNTILWQQAKEYMDHSKSTLWPTELLNQAFEDKFYKAVQQGPIALDGYIRLEEQVESFMTMVKRCNIPRIVVIDLRASDSVCIGRAISRGREDDADIYLRLKQYHEDSIPALHCLLGLVDSSIERIIYRGDLPDDSADSYRQRFVEGLSFVYNLGKKS